MNRPIKFRAWDKDSKVMFYGVDFIDGFWTEGGIPKLGALYGSIDTLMQFTGLLDKKGKEIYEGDVVLYQFLDGGWAEQPVVYGGAAFGVHGFLLNQISGDGTKLEVEIIGNIYENPELIK